MAPLNAKYVKKGRSANLVGLRRQWKVSRKHAQTHALRLKGAGWLAEDTARLAADGGELDSERSTLLEKRTRSKARTRTEAQKRQEAKRVIRVVRNALPSVVKNLEEEEAKAITEQFLVGGKLGNSTALISAYLARIAGPLKELDGAFARFNNEKSLYAELTAIAAELDAADTEQEAGLDELPAETLAFYELKGRVLDAIEELNRLAKNAFDGEAELIGLFNKDLLLDATRRRLQVEDEEDAQLAS